MIRGKENYFNKKNRELSRRSLKHDRQEARKVVKRFFNIRGCGDARNDTLQSEGMW